jgi:hypothetical protein
MSVYHYERGHGHIERVPQDESTSKRKVAYVAFDDDQETKNINETGSKKYPITQEELDDLYKMTAQKEFDDIEQQKSVDAGQEYTVILKHSGCDPKWCPVKAWEEAMALPDAKQVPRPVHKKRKGWTGEGAYLFGEKLKNALFAQQLKGSNNYWNEASMEQLCTPYTSQSCESFMRKDMKRNPKCKDKSKSPQARQSTTMSAVEQQADRTVHGIILEEEMGIAAGQFMTKQLAEMAEKCIRLVDLRQTQAYRGFRLLRQREKKGEWSTLSPKDSRHAYYGHGGGFESLNEQ